MNDDINYDTIPTTLPEQDYEDDRKFLGVWIPADIFFARDLSPTQKMLWADIKFLGRKYGCFMSNEAFSIKYGITIRSIRKNITHLIDTGYIVIKKFDGRKRFLDITGKGDGIDSPTPQNLREEQKFPSERNKSYPLRGTKVPPAYILDNNLENNKINIYSDNGFFEKIWAKYPVKDGKNSAIKHFKRTVKTKEDWENINKALNNYLNSKRVLDGFIKNGSTWFNNWRDFINWEEKDGRIKGIFREKD